ncbi:MAG: AmmeMemoRadiSam system protein A [Thermoanaerobaculia bacterium]
MLNPEQRNRLLQIARDSIAGVLAGRRLDLQPDDFDEPLQRPSGAFVSLHKPDRELRGCIGSVQAVYPLYQAVVTSAINAAFRDPRFYPLQVAEFPEVHIEISVMSPIVLVTNSEEIEVGRDGLIVSRGRYAGLLLPQVATEYGWDRETFLKQTCVKAGLPPDAWRHLDVRIERFSAEVFGE